MDWSRSAVYKPEKKENKNPAQEEEEKSTCRRRKKSIFFILKKISWKPTIERKKESWELCVCVASVSCSRAVRTSS